MTKPFRAESKGQEALIGSEDVDRAFNRANPAIDNGLILASAPPASMRSAYPNLIKLNASPMLCDPAAQAVATEWTGPLRPYLIETFPAAMFTRILGTKYGLTFLNDLLKLFCVSMISLKLPMPPIMKKHSAHLIVVPRLFIV